jgi:hypothetical protein
MIELLVPLIAAVHSEAPHVDTPFIDTSIVIAATALASFLAWVGVTRARRAEAVDKREHVEQEAYTRAQGIYVQALKTQNDEVNTAYARIKQLNGRVSELETELDECLGALGPRRGLPNLRDNYAQEKARYQERRGDQPESA